MCFGRELMSATDIGPFWRAVCKSCRYEGNWHPTEYNAKKDLEKHLREHPDHKGYVQERERIERDIN